MMFFLIESLNLNLSLVESASSLYDSFDSSGLL
jgi:hypothetical protein